MNKRVISALLSVCMTSILVTGCTGKDEKGSSDESNSNVLTMTGWYTEENMKPVFDKLDEVLQGKYKIEYTYIGLDNYNNVISTQLAAGEGPDILVDGSNFPARIRAGNLKDITGSSRLEGFNEAGMNLCTSRDGKVYGIPSYGWFSGLWYNKDIFEQNGITKLPKTFDEFVAVCDKLKANGVQALGFGLADGDSGMHSVLGYLENAFYEVSEQGKSFDEKFAYGEEKMDGNINKYIEDWSILIKKGHITPEMVGISNDQALSDFISGKTAMFNSGPWHYTNFKEADMNFGMLPHMGNNENVSYLLGGPAASIGINKNTKNPEGAEAVLDAFASVEVQQAFADTNTGSFSYKEGVNINVPQEYDIVKPILEKGDVACSWERWGVNMPSQTLVDEFIAQLQGVITGDLTVDQFVKAIDNKANSIRYE